MLPTTADIEAARIAWANHRADARERTDSLKARCYMQIVKYEKHVHTHRGRLTPSQASRREQLKADAEKAQAYLVLISHVLEKHDKRVLPGADEGPTTEQIVRGALEQAAANGNRRPFTSRKARDPLLTLWDDGKISDDDLHDAREIAGIFRRVTARSHARTTNYGALSEPGEEGQRFLVTDVEEYYLLLHARVYLPWAKSIDKDDLGMTLGLVVEGLTLRALRTKYGRRTSTILERITEALESYRRIRGNHYRGEVEPMREAA